MSIPLDVAGTDEDGGRGRTPKGSFYSEGLLGHRVNNPVTVIWCKISDGALSRGRESTEGVTPA